MMVRKCVMAMSLALGAVSAQAAQTQIDLGTLGGNGTQLSFAEQGASANNFFHIYDFSLQGPSNVSGSFSELVGLTLDRVKLAGSLGDSVFSNLDANNGFSFNNLPSGYFSLYAFGAASSGINSYSGSLMAQPVPEPQTIAMLLAGLGLVGAAVARRRQSR